MKTEELLKFSEPLDYSEPKGLYFQLQTNEIPKKLSFSLKDIENAIHELYYGKLYYPETKPGYDLSPENNRPVDGAEQSSTGQGNIPAVRNNESGTDNEDDRVL